MALALQAKSLILVLSLQVKFLALALQIMALTPKFGIAYIQYSFLWLLAQQSLSLQSVVLVWKCIHVVGTAHLLHFSIPVTMMSLVTEPMSQLYDSFPIYTSYVLLNTQYTGVMQS